DLIDGINDAVIKALPDRQLADQVINSIENYVANKSDELLHEDAKEKHRRSADRRAKESRARDKHETELDPTPDILDNFPIEENEEDAAQDTALEEEAELMPLGIQTSDPTITIHPLSPTPTPEPTAAPHSQMPSPPAAQLHTHNSSLTPQASLVTQ